jgi:hypothetical protein
MDKPAATAVAIAANPLYILKRPFTGIVNVSADPPISTVKFDPSFEYSISTALKSHSVSIPYVIHSHVPIAITCLAYLSSLFIIPYLH